MLATRHLPLNYSDAVSSLIKIKTPAVWLQEPLLSYINQVQSWK